MKRTTNHSAYLPDSATLSALLNRTRGVGNTQQPAPPAAPLPPRPNTEPFSSAETAPEPLFEAFLDWCARTTQASSLFIADAEGLTIANRGTPDSFLALAGELLAQTRSISTYLPEAERAPISLAFEREVLQVLPSNGGQVWMLGLVLTQPLNNLSLRSLRQAMDTCTTQLSQPQTP
ncbi:MAG: hypothetical protein R3B07_15100 [Polyangiaceae bacterium]